MTTKINNGAPKRKKGGLKNKEVIYKLSVIKRARGRNLGALFAPVFTATACSG